MNRQLAIAALPLALTWCAADGRGDGNADDQAAAEAAVAVFNWRLTAAGWVSYGPPRELESAEIRDDRPFGDCFEGLDVVVLANTEHRLEGETARAFTDDFRIGDLGPDSTDPVPDNGYIAAGVFTVTDSSVDALDEVITVVGAGETAACLTRPGTAQGDTATHDEDIGVGDASARLEVSYSMGELGHVSETVLAARIDRSLVTMVVYTGGAFQLDLNPIAELTAMINAVGNSSP